VSEVSCPNMIFINWVSGHEKVGINNLDILGFLSPTTLSSIRFDSEQIHHSFDAFSI